MSFNEKKLIDLAQCTYNNNVTSTERIAQSGSNRIYVRLFLANGETLMGAYNDNVKENDAFFAFTNFFLQKKIQVPHLLAISNDRQYYLLTDLGDETLYSFLTNRRTNTLSNEVFDYYKKVIRQLPIIQLSGKQNFDFSVCYPRHAFDRQSMQWDLNYFKYYFLKLAGIPFDEQLLENDFNTLINYLLEIDQDYFLFRDFQSRNIMLHEGEVYFIDYQGGRKGALPYDIASLLYDAKADLPQAQRAELLDYYLTELEKYIPTDKASFLQYFDAYALIRIMQSMGAYGYRGYYEKKKHFLQSIPYATRNIRYILENTTLSINTPTLRTLLTALTEIDWEAKMGIESESDDQLNVIVTSFSYKKGIPADNSSHGGGFVFDCRALPNPGREAQYKAMTGRDPMVIGYLEEYPVVTLFKQNIFSLVDISVDNYIERKFTHLSVHFGCTGGQHRSVYFAQATADHLRHKYPTINVILKHTNI